MKPFSKLNYPVKVWLFTILVTPIVVIALLIIYNSAAWTAISQVVPLFLYMSVLGAALSLPSLYLFWLWFKEMKNSSLKNWLKKTTFAAGLIFFIWLTFYLLDRDFFNDADINELMWPGLYSIILAIGIIIFKFDKPEIKEQ